MTLAAILAGDMQPNMMWPACRLEHRGAVAFGIEAIADTFRREPFITQSALVVEGKGATVFVREDAGVFVEHFEGIVTRIWRVDSEKKGDRGEVSLIVPFDTDLQQERGGVVFDAADHPDFEPDAVKHLTKLLAALDAPDDCFRVRAFVVRAFGSEASGAAVVMLQGLAHPVRYPICAGAIVVWTADGARHVRDVPWSHGKRGSLVE